MNRIATRAALTICLLTAGPKTSDGQGCPAYGEVFGPVLSLSPVQGKEPLKEITNSIGMKFRCVPEGTFLMGLGRSPLEISRLTPLYGGIFEWIKASERPQHTRVISKPFYLGVTEVTQAQWTKVMSSRPWKDKTFVEEGPSFPATWVSWNDAIKFCRRLSEMEGKQYRLPSEEEWEYACRADTRTIFSFGDDVADLEEHGWFEANGYKIKGQKFPHRVMSKKPNPWGFYDMHGNVWEWCGDAYAPYARKQADSREPSTLVQRVARGGSWRNSATHSRSSFRFRFVENHVSNDVGFRVVLLAETEQISEESANRRK